MRLHNAVFCLPALLTLGACSDPKLDAVTVSCESSTLTAGASTRCSAAARDEEDKGLTVTYTWSSSDSSVATVDGSGNVKAVAVGTVDVRATAVSDGVTREGSASLTISARPPTVHATPISASETWTRADGPHYVRGSVVVGGASAPVLTVEAGVEVRFEAGAELLVSQGSLKAQGTEAQRVRFVADQATPTRGFWRGVVLSNPAVASTLDYVTLSGCGLASDDVTLARPCLRVDSAAAPVLRHVSVEDSASAGVVLSGEGSAFGPGSTALSVSGSAGYAVRLGANQAGTLPPDSTFTANTPNGLLLSGDVTRTQTWPNPGTGVSYFVEEDIHVGSAAGTLLTVAAGTQLRFMPQRRLLVGDTAPGDLVLAGTEQSPLLLTAAVPVKERTDYWEGVWLMEKSSAASRLTHTTLEYSPDPKSSTGAVALLGDGQPGSVRALLDHVTVRQCGAYGVSLENEALLAPGSTGLSITQCTRGPISTHANGTSSIPADSRLTGNTRDVAFITGGYVTFTQTWAKLEVPYYIDQEVYVGSSSKPTLTLTPDTTLLVASGIVIGPREDAPGSLIAFARSERITFTTVFQTPRPGAWSGLHFRYAEGSRLQSVIVRYAGANFLGGTGGINVYREIGPFMMFTDLISSSGCGITISDGSRPGTTPVTTDFADGYGNAFIGNAGGRICTY